MLSGSIDSGWAASPGASGGVVLSIPAGARAIAMGEAYTAMADDASSLYWNPAGIAFLNQSQASFMHNQYLDDLRYNNASVATPLEYGGVGASVSYLSYGDIEAFDAEGNSAGSLSAYSGVMTVGGSVLGNNWAAGANVKAIQEKLADTRATGFAGDFGVSALYPKSIYGGTLRAAVALRNFGSGLKYIDQNDPFPRQWRVGLALVNLLDRRLGLAVDYGQERERDGALYAGAEYWVLRYMALRAGYAGNDQEGSPLRAGMGLRYKDLSFDYAFSDYGALGASHRYELTFRFGVIQPRLTPEERALLRRAKLALAEKRHGEATLLFDSLIQLVPNYRPARRLVKLALAGYEQSQKEDPAVAAVMIRHRKPDSPYEIDEMKDMEKLLTMTEEQTAQNAQLLKRSSQENRP